MVNTIPIFKSLISLASECNTEEKCLEYLLQKRWGGKVTCEDCKGETKLYFIEKRNLYKCAGCRQHISIRKGTIFHSSKISLRIWFFAIYIVTEKTRGVSSIQLAKDIGVNQKTAWLMMHKIRQAMNEENESVLSGIVEIDEGYCGASRARDKRLSFKIYRQKELRIQMDAEGEEEKKARLKKEKKAFEKTGKQTVRMNKLALGLDMVQSYATRLLLADKNHRMSQYQPIHYKKNILGMLQRDGNLVLKKVGRQRGDICQENVMPILQNHITEDTHIMTDEHKAYINVNKQFKIHSVVKHSRPKDDFKTKIKYSEKLPNSDIDKTTNGIENVWNQFKKIENCTYVHFSWKYTDRYLDEFSFRYNNRELGRGEKFNAFMNKISGKSISRRELMNTNAHYVYIAK